MLGIGYIQKFFTRERSDPYSLPDMLRLSANLAAQPIKEIAGYHKRLIKEPYLGENELADWLPYLYSTLQGVLFRHYFRPEAINFENIPEGGAMLVANHSGMWGWDGMALKCAVFSSTGRTVTGMSHRIFDGSDLAKTMGMVTGTREAAVELLKDERLVMVCPGGGREVAKPFSERYKVQRVGGFARGRYGYLLAALEAGKPIVPVGIVGAEETHIILGNIKPRLDRMVDRIYARLPGRMKRAAEPYKERWDTSKTFPLMLNPVPFPSRIQARIGKPLRFDMVYSSFPVEKYRRLRDEQKRDPKAVDGTGFYCLESMLNSMNEQVLDEIQALIDNDVRYVTSQDGQQSVLVKF